MEATDIIIINVKNFNFTYVLTMPHKSIYITIERILKTM